MSVSADVGQYSWGMVIRSFMQDVFVHLGSPHVLHVLHAVFEQGGLRQLSHRIVDGSVLFSLHFVVMSVYLFMCRCVKVFAKFDRLRSPQTTHVIALNGSHALHCHVESVSADVGQY